MARTVKDWRNFGDVNFPTHGGQLARYVGEGVVQIIELYTEVDGEEKSWVGFYSVDLPRAAQAEIAPALRSCGTDMKRLREEIPDGIERCIRVALMVAAYTGRFREAEWMGPVKETRRMLRKARRLAQ